MTSRRATRTSRPTSSPLSRLLAPLVLVLVAGCSFVGSGDDDTGTTVQDTTAPSAGGGESAPAPDGGDVVLLTHNDFYLPDEVVAAFEEESGYTLDIRPTDGVGNLVNLVSAQAGKPSGDVVFGIDNTFASRALGAGALTSYDDDLPDDVATYALPGDDDGDLVPVDNGNVCVNVDETWFADKGIAPPETLADLADPTYAELLVVPSAASSSPGLAFLLSTIAEYGDDWPTYWEDLLDGGAEIVAGWSEAYEGEFTQGGGGGDRPIVVSYDSSPAFTVDKAGGTTTSALLDTCYLQVEYAAALDGAPNPEGAQALLDFLLSPTVQAALPDSMYVFPVVEETELPADWATFATRPTTSYEVDPAEIEANREDWLIEWTDLISR